MKNMIKPARIMARETIYEYFLFFIIFILSLLCSIKLYIFPAGYVCHQSQYILCKKHCCNHRRTNTNYQGDSKALDRSCSKAIQDYACNECGNVGIQN